MKLDAELTLREYENVLGGYTALLSFRLMNLCVKADPGALLAVQVEARGQMKNIEDVAKVSVSSDKTMDVYPLHEELLQPVGLGVMQVHPEFKQSIQTVHLDSKNKDIRYIQLTIPEVNKDRYDVLNNGVDAFYNETKAQLDINRQKYLIELNTTMADESKVDVDEAKEQFDKLYDDNCKMAQQSVDDKKKEIEEAYQHYLEKVNERNLAEQDQQAAEGQGIIDKMKLPFGND